VAPVTARDFPQQAAGQPDDPWAILNLDNMATAARQAAVYMNIQAKR
jgi:hypothetical protein